MPDPLCVPSVPGMRPESQCGHSRSPEGMPDHYADQAMGKSTVHKRPKWPIWIGPMSAYARSC
ncbi:hypothetical protein AN958_04379 [Leucoagaricus sp. SymC.cos]|nr:hypothetical protein AN958_04379 [Leucoagaricus sp. SymC.cos]